MLVSRKGKVYEIISATTENRPNGEVQYFAGLFSFLQLVATIICTQSLFSKWSELTVTWPNELTFCLFVGVVFVCLKLAQLFSISGDADNGSKFWILFFIGIISIFLLSSGVLACRLVRLRSLGIDVWQNTTSNSYTTRGIFPKNNRTAVYSRDLTLLTSMQNYDLMKLDRIAWDVIQPKYGCCGSDSYYDWLDLIEEIPKSCCQQLVDYKCLLPNAYKNGCSKKLKGILFDRIRYLEITLFLVVCLETIISAVVLCTIGCNTDVPNKRDKKTCNFSKHNLGKLKKSLLIEGNIV